MRLVKIVFLSYLSGVLFVAPVFSQTTHKFSNPKKALDDRSVLLGIYPTNISEVSNVYYVDELDDTIVQFESVLFDRFSNAVFSNQFQREKSFRWVRRVLDLGTGTGILALQAIKKGAIQAVGTEIDPLAVKNARFNAKRLGYQNKFDVRLVSFDQPEAFSAIGSHEKFDLILSDPPDPPDFSLQNKSAVVTGELKNPKERLFGLDPEHRFFISIINGLNEHLADKGRAWICLRQDGSKQLLRELAEKNNLEVKVLFDSKKDLDLRGKRLSGDEKIPMATLRRNVLFEVRKKLNKE